MADQPQRRQWDYTAVSSTGARAKGKMLAESQAEVTVALHSSGYTPLSIKRASSLSLDADVSEIFAKLKKKEPKFKTSEVAQFTRQLYQLLRAGIPVQEAMATLAETQEDAQIKEALTTIADRITAGESMAEAFDGYPKLFDEVFVAYMSAADSSGDTVAVVDRLAGILDKRAEITRKVVAVSTYPLLVMGAIMLMLAVIILFIVPRYATIYASLDAPLPGPTKMVVTLSKVFPFLIAIVVAAVVGFVSVNKSRKDDLVFGTKIDKVRFKTPIFGKLFTRLVLYRFASTLSGSIDAGVQMFDGLDLAGRASASRWIRSTVPELQDSIRSGRPLAAALNENTELYPTILRRMVETGEKAGELATMLRHVAETVEDEIDLYISTMSAKIEVAMLCFMGVSVGTILISLYLPILKLSTTVGDKVGF